MKNLLLTLSSQKACWADLNGDGSFCLRKGSLCKQSLYASDGSVLVNSAEICWIINRSFYYSDGVIYKNAGEAIAEYDQAVQTDSSRDGKFTVEYLSGGKLLTDLYDASGKCLLEKKQRIVLLWNGWYFYPSEGEKIGVLTRNDASIYLEKVLDVGEVVNHWFWIKTEKGDILCRETGEPVSDYVESCGVYPEIHWYWLQINKLYHLYRADESKVGVFDHFPDVSPDGMYVVKGSLYDLQNVLVDTAKDISVCAENKWYRKKSDDGEYTICRYDKSVIVEKNVLIEILSGKMYRYVDDGKFVVCKEDGTVLLDAPKVKLLSNGKYWMGQDSCLYTIDGKKLFDKATLVQSYGDFLLICRDERIWIVAEADILLPILSEVFEIGGDSITKEQFEYFMEYFRFLNVFPKSISYMDLLKSFV